MNTRSFRNTDSAGNSAPSSPPLMDSPGREGKHPLNNDWTLWYYSHNANMSWEENLSEVVTFNTVEDFWGIYNHIELASDLREKCDYSIFKKGIKPMWEDRANVKGGRWIISFDAKRRHKDSVNLGLDGYWIELLMCLVGEAFGEEYGNVINGAVVSVRNRNDKISLWLSNYVDPEVVKNIGAVIKERLNLFNVCTIIFEAHEEAQKKSTKHSSAAKLMFKM